MNKNSWEQQQHNQNKKTLDEIVKKIARQIFIIRSIEFSKELVGSGWRLVVYLKEVE